MGVAHPDGFGELRQLDPGRLGEDLALVGGEPRPVLDEIAGELGGEPGAERSHGEGEGADRLEHGTGALDGLGVTADHADEIAAGGRGGTSGDAAVDDRHSCRRRLGPDRLDALGRDGAHHHENRLGPCDGESPLRTGEHRVHLLVVDHRHDHRVRAPGDVRRGLGDLRLVAVSSRSPRAGRRRPPVGVRPRRRSGPSRRRGSRARSPRPPASPCSVLVPSLPARGLPPCSGSRAGDARRAGPARPQSAADAFPGQLSRL